MMISDQELLSDHAELQALSGHSFFITGSTGFFGLNLLESLLYLNRTFHLGMRFTLLVRNRVKAEKLFANLPIANGSVYFLESDLLGLPNLALDTSSFDSVIHLAASTEMRSQAGALEFEQESIIEGTRNVLALAGATKSRKLVYLSSGAVYGPLAYGLTSQAEIAVSQLQPNRSDLYGKAKVEAERLCEEYRSKFGIKCTVFRGFALAGPHLKLSSPYAICSLISSAIQGQPLIVRDGAVVRSYLNIVDAVIWILKATLRTDDAATYNMGSDKGFALEEIAHRISAKFGNLPVEILDRSEKPNRYVPNIDLARQALGVQDYTSLEQTLLNMIQWHQSE